MLTIRHERAKDIPARESLLHRSFGDCRFTKASERLREGRLPAQGLSLVAVESGEVVGTVRLWNVSAGPGCPALLLGPLAVDPACRNRGIGAALMKRAAREASWLGHSAILLVGDASYYSRFGFSTEKTAGLWMPGAYDQHRLLAHELREHAMIGARGMVGATGRLAPQPDLRTLVAGLRRDHQLPRAA